jgi:hypothetical protein
MFHCSEQSFLSTFNLTQAQIYQMEYEFGRWPFLSSLQDFEVKALHIRKARSHHQRPFLAYFFFSPTLLIHSIFFPRSHAHFVERQQQANTP